MNRIIPALFLALCAGLAPAVPVRFAADVTKAQTHQATAYRGETLEIEAALFDAGRPLTNSAPAALYWQTNGMDTAWWTAPAAMSGGVIRATWSPTNDVGAAAYRVFLGVTDGGQNFRANMTLRVAESPGSVPNALPLPAHVIDFAEVGVASPEAAPFALAAEIGATSRVDRAYADSAVSAAIQDGTIGSYVNGLSWVDGDKSFGWYGITDAFSVYGGSVYGSLDADYITANYDLTAGWISAGGDVVCQGDVYNGSGDSLAGKMNKNWATAGNFALFDGAGDLQDSYFTPESFAAYSHTHGSGEITDWGAAVPSAVGNSVSGLVRADGTGGLDGVEVDGTTIKIVNGVMSAQASGGAGGPVGGHNLTVNFGGARGNCTLVVIYADGTTETIALTKGQAQTVSKTHVAEVYFKPAVSVLTFTFPMPNGVGIGTGYNGSNKYLLNTDSIGAPMLSGAVAPGATFLLLSDQAWTIS